MPLVFRIDWHGYTVRLQICRFQNWYEMSLGIFFAYLSIDSFLHKPLHSWYPESCLHLNYFICMDNWGLQEFPKKTDICRMLLIACQCFFKNLEGDGIQQLVNKLIKLLIQFSICFGLPVDVFIVLEPGSAIFVYSYMNEWNLVCLKWSHFCDECVYMRHLYFGFGFFVDPSKWSCWTVSRYKHVGWYKLILMTLITTYRWSRHRSIPTDNSLLKQLVATTMK